MKNRPTEPRTDAEAPLPAWLPGGAVWDRLAPEFQVTVRDVLAPAYRQLVIEVGNPFERAAGMVIVQLAWLEAWNFQRVLKDILAPPDPLQLDANTWPDRRVSRQLALAAAKCQATQLLSMLQRVRKHIEPLLPKSAILPPQAIAPSLKPSSGIFIEPSVPPIGNGSQDASLEKSRSVDQNQDQHPEVSPAIALIHANPLLFARQGTVVATYRKVGQRVYGPYYRLAYRVDGRQQSVYIGRNPEQADEVRTALSNLQAPRRRLREMDDCEREVHRSLRLAKLKAGTTLRLVGLRFHGHEIRGWRDNSSFAVIPRRTTYHFPMLPTSLRRPWPSRCLQSLQREAERALRKLVKSG